MTVSAIVPVKNEIGNIRPCLEHLAWCDEVFVVDSQSTDGTVDAAEEMGAQVVQFRYTGELPKKKNWSLENLPFRNEWGLIVDADERIPAELAEEIQAAVGRGDADGYFINRKFMFMGKWIRHCGYYPSWNMRLFKHAQGRYERIEDSTGATGDNEVHEHVVLDGHAGYLRSDMLHHAYPSIATWVEKHNRYSEWEAHVAPQLLQAKADEHKLGARQALTRRLKRVYLHLPLRFVFRFLYAYVLRRGFLDGRRGFVFCVLLAFYDFLSWAKQIEAQSQRPAEP